MNRNLSYQLGMTILKAWQTELLTSLLVITLVITLKVQLEGTHISVLLLSCLVVGLYIHYSMVWLLMVCPFCLLLHLHTHLINGIAFLLVVCNKPKLADAPCTAANQGRLCQIEWSDWWSLVLAIESLIIHFVPRRIWSMNALVNGCKECVFTTHKGDNWMLHLFMF